MCADAGKCRLLHAVFLSYFIFFTFSTLSYNLMDEQLSRAFEEPAGADIIMPRLFLLELIGSTITHHTCSGSSQSALRIIFLKKRAVLPTENIIRKTLARDHMPIIHVTTMPEGVACALPERESGTLLHERLLTLYSDISPPSSAYALS